MNLTRNAELGLAVLRIAAGIVFAAHGAQKLFVYGISGTTQSFAQMGIPLATLAAPLDAFTEFFGGLALILGFGTRIASVLLAATMLGAILFVHLKAGFFLPRGFEYPFMLLAATTGLALAGPGAVALENRFRRTTTESATLSRVA